jgi:hypothetical protein
MRILSAVLALGLIPGTGVSHAEPAADKLIGDIEGVYKHRFQNGLVTGEKYQSEDVVEIVRYDDTRIYVRAELQFFNGHECSISGIARYDGGRFAYDEPPSDPGAQACHFQIGVDGKAIRFGDADGVCRASHCGARGGLDGYTIARDSKRRIRYMDRLKNSNEYRQAVSELKK